MPVLGKRNVGTRELGPSEHLASGAKRGRAKGAPTERPSKVSKRRRLGLYKPFLPKLLGFVGRELSRAAWAGAWSCKLRALPNAEEGDCFFNWKRLFARLGLEALPFPDADETEWIMERLAAMLRQPWLGYVAKCAPAQDEVLELTVSWGPD